MPARDHVEAVRAVYDVAASTYVEFVGTQISSATEGAIDRSLLWAFVELIRRDPGPVADIGCGPGRVAAFLAQHGLDVTGVDPSEGMLGAARSAHPHIRFEEGELAALPFDAGVLAGGVCWYSIIYTPPNRLDEVFVELGRVLRPGGHLLLGFHAGHGEPVHRESAHGTGLPLTSYLHHPDQVGSRLEHSHLAIRATTVRAPELDHESTPQGFLLARKET